MHREPRTVQEIMNPQQKSTLALILLLIASVAGNWLSLPVFYGIDFLFGSIAVLLVFQLYGMRWGVLAAAFASLQTYWMWNHPYGGIIFFVEAVLVGFLCRRRRANLVLVDGIYWLLLGMPLCWIFYRMALDIPVIPTTTIALKQGINGVFNALVASLILTHVPLPTWVGRSHRRYQLSMQQLLFNLLVAFVFFPSLTVMAIYNWQAVYQIEADIRDNLSFTASELVSSLQQRQQLRVNSLTELGRMAQMVNMQPNVLLQQQTQFLQRIFTSLQTVAIQDRSDRTIAISTDAQSPTDLSTIFSELTCSSTTFGDRQAWISDGYRNSQNEPSLGLIVPILSPAGDAPIGCIVSEVNLNIFSQVFPSHTNAGYLRLLLLDRRDRILATTEATGILQQYEYPPLNQRVPLDDENGEVFRWMPDDPNLPALTRWQRSVYTLQQTLEPDLPWQLVIDIAALPYITQLQSQYIQNLTILILVAVLAFVLAGWVSRRLVAPLSQLLQVTTNLPDKLLEQPILSWPSDGAVREIEWLIGNFQVMAATLYQKFQEIQQARETLEQRVQERTDELSQANEALQRSYSFLKAQQEAAIDGILAVDENRAVTSYNLRFCQMWNIPIDAINAIPLSAKDVTDLLNGVLANLSNPENFSDRIEELSLNPRVISQELLYLRDGRIVEYYSAPVFSADEQFYGRIWYFRDITEPYLAAEELKQSYKSLSDIHYALEQAAIVSTTDAEGKIIYVNDKFCEIGHYSQTELLKRNQFELLDSTYHPPEFYEEIWQTLQSGRIWRGETRHRTSNGIYWLNTTIVPFINEQNQPFQYLSIAFDISERKRAEEDLKAFAAKLEQSNRELQDFAYVASHDLQEPLRKIQAFSDRLVTKYNSQLNEQAQDYLSRIHNAASRMQTLIQDLLSFSRVTTKAQPYACVNLEQIAQEVLNDLEMRLEQTQGQVTIHPLPTIEADPVQIRQLWQNLISNALKFHRVGVPPAIEISAEPLPENTDFPQSYQIYVQDNGIGFDPKYTDRIFNIFQRLHGRNHYEGTGVGLAICRKIVERHGGTITATSQPDQGTTFIVTLPVKQHHS